MEIRQNWAGIRGSLVKRHKVKLKKALKMQCLNGTKMFIGWKSGSDEDAMKFVAKNLPEAAKSA